MSRRDATLQTLVLALHRIERGTPKIISVTRKLSVMALAQEAGLHPSTIHTRYPAIAEKVRMQVSRSSRTQRDKKVDEVREAKSANALLRKEITDTRALLGKLASENARLIAENAELRAVHAGRNVLMLRK